MYTLLAQKKIVLKYSVILYVVCCTKIIYLNQQCNKFNIATPTNTGVLAGVPSSFINEYSTILEKDNKVLPFEFSDKIYGDDYNYIAGKTVFGTKDEPKVISLEDIGKGKAYETYDLLQGEMLEEYKAGLTNLRTNKASNLEIKETGKYFVPGTDTS